MTRVEVLNSAGITLAMFSWTTGSEYYGWEAFKSYMKCLDTAGKSFTVEITFPEKV